MRIALLDDYQDVALKMAHWARLPPSCEVVVFRDHLDDEDAIVERLSGFDVDHGDARAHAVDRSTTSRACRG